MNIFNLEMVLAAWPIVLGFYLFWCWGLPMLGMSVNRWTNEAAGLERKRRYWAGVRFTSMGFHAGLIGAYTLMYFLSPYLFTGA